MKLTVPPKALIPLAINVKESMGIQQYINFKDMNVAEIEIWISAYYSVNPEIVIR